VTASPFAATQGRAPRAAATIEIDDLADPRLPRWMRAWNALPAPLARRLAPLSEDSLVRAARRRTGLSDLGDPGFREPFRVLLESLEGEARLTPFGRTAVRGLLVQLLSNRLLLEELVRRHPEIEDERIERPIVIAGLPRTGTSHLFNLLSRDPGLRCLPYWESLEPVPDPSRWGLPFDPDADPRRSRCRRALDFMTRVMPLFPAMHEFGVDEPHEEIQLLAMEFSTQLFEASYSVPRYGAWYRDTDQGPAYRRMRRVLKALQWLRGPRRWLLKSPQHLENLGPLIETFPDARIVQTHRDPVRVVASLVTMIVYGRRMSNTPVDVRGVARHWASRVGDMLRASVRDRERLPASQVMDVQFGGFMANPLATVERAFALGERPFDAATRAAVSRFLEHNPRGKHGTIRYSLEAVGLDEAELRRDLRFYQERFDVPSEEG